MEGEDARTVGTGRQTNAYVRTYHGLPASEQERGSVERFSRVHFPLLDVAREQTRRLRHEEAAERLKRSNFARLASEWSGRSSGWTDVE